MRSLTRRLERLEKAVTTLQGTHCDIIKGALRLLSSAELDLVLTSFGAERRGRPMNAQETAARKRLGADVEKRCRAKGLIPPRSGWTLNIEHIHDAFVYSLLQRYSEEGFSLDEFSLPAFFDIWVRLDSGQDAVLTEEESCIGKVYKSEKQRFAQLTGFESIEDFNRVCKAKCVNAG
jgi:hypothetical protein